MRSINVSIGEPTPARENPLTKSFWLFGDFPDLSIGDKYTLPLGSIPTDTIASLSCRPGHQAILLTDIQLADEGKVVCTVLGIDDAADTLYQYVCCRLENALTYDAAFDHSLQQAQNIRLAVKTRREWLYGFMKDAELQAALDSIGGEVRPLIPRFNLTWQLAEQVDAANSLDDVVRLLLSPKRTPLEVASIASAKLWRVAEVGAVALMEKLLTESHDGDGENEALKAFHESQMDAMQQFGRNQERQQQNVFLSSWLNTFQEDWEAARRSLK